MSFLGNIFSKAVASPTSPLSGAYSGAVAAGSVLIAAVMLEQNVTAYPTVSDNAGNTYTHVVGADTVSAYNTVLYVCTNCAAISASNTFSVAWTGSVSNIAAAIVLAFSTTQGALDVGVANTSGASTSQSVGPTAAVAQTHEIVVAAFGGYDSASAQTFTAGSGYTGVPIATATISGPYTYYLAVEYAILSAASGGQTATVTLGIANTSGTGAIGAFLGNPPVAGSNKIPNVPTLPSLETIGS